MRRQRKRRYTYDEADADGEEGESSEPDEESSPPTLAANKVKKMMRKSPPPPNPCDTQRNLLSSLLKSKVNHLPLPAPIKIFVNMNRDF